MENLELLINELRKSTAETPWLEFKHNNYDPDMIGKDISALANSAALHEKSCAYMIWGIDDSTHEIIGTDQNPSMLKIGNQDFEIWLRTMLSQNANFEFQTCYMNNKSIVLLIIYKAIGQTVTFKKIDYIRVGSNTTQLNNYPSMKTQLWDRIRLSKFEEMPSKKDLFLENALSFIDYSSYFDLKQEPIPTNINGIEHYLLEENILLKQDDGRYSITNLGALLFAKHLSDFPSVARKAVRVVQYKGDNRLQMLKEYTGGKGYAIGFSGLIEFIEALLPTSEEITGAFREKSSIYPLLAIREAVANALIHQDLSISGTGPVIEIFDNRIEITNPGTPLVDVRRIIDNPPKSRNEKMASLMRRLRMCEELGTGWDKIVITCELYQLPAPKITLYEENTKVTIFSYVSFSNISIEDKLWACYLHACIKQVSSESISNRSLRERFGLEETSSASISRLLKEAVNAGIIKPLDPNTAPKYMRYIPIWA